MRLPTQGPEPVPGPPPADLPTDLRVLVVDDDPLCLMIVAKMLRRCNYEVTTCTRGADALQLLRESEAPFDLVLSDVYMPDMDGFKLMEQVALELDVPVIMMSANGETSVVLRGITHGAADYLLKPIRIEELRNLWQHVVRRRRSSVNDASPGGGSPPRLREKRGGAEKSAPPPPVAAAKRRDPETGDATGPCTKKARVVWSVELHQQFVNAVNALGVDKAVPKRILDLMGVQGLTRENVASHLQKYRLYLKRIQGLQEHGGAHGGAQGGAGAGADDFLFGGGNTGGRHGAADAPLHGPGHLGDLDMGLDLGGPSATMSALLSQLPPHPLLPPSLAAELALPDDPSFLPPERGAGSLPHHPLAPLSPLILPSGSGMDADCDSDDLNRFLLDVAMTDAHALMT